MKSGNNDPSKSMSWKVLETVLSHLKKHVSFFFKVGSYSFVYITIKRISRTFLDVRLLRALLVRT